MKLSSKSLEKPLGQILVERGIINCDQLNQVLEVQKTTGGLVGDILIARNMVKEMDIMIALMYQYGFPYLPLTKYNISDDVLKGISSDLCYQHCLIPVDKIGKNVMMAMANPLNMCVLEELETVIGNVIQVFISTPTEIKQAIKKFYKAV